MKKIFLVCILILCAASGFSQTIRVTGVVKDSNGEPVAGAAVLIEGTFTGTTTAPDGSYSLDNVTTGQTLRCQSLGYQDEEAVAVSSTVDFVLTELATDLGQVVVVGYGTMKRSDLTGSVASVKPEVLARQPAASFEQGLEGRIAGLQVIPDNSPGGGASIRIRGGSSLYSSNTPYLIVDGFPIGEAGNLKQIAPEDIESIDILKDASASAIYGSRGANGVIIITTKRAKAGQTRIDVSNQTTFSQFSSELDIWRNMLLMAQLSNEERINGGMTPLYVGAKDATGVYYPSLGEIASGEWPHFTKWDKVIFRDVPVNNITNVNLSSANDRTAFALNLSYLTQQGNSIKDVYRKGNVNFNISHKISDAFTVKFNTILAKDYRNANGLGLRNPIFPVYNEDGSYYMLNSQDYGHPIAISDHRKNKSNGFDNLSMLGLDIRITPTLTLTSQANYKYGNSVNDQYLPPVYTEEGNNTNGYGYIGNGTWQNVTSESYLTYTNTWNGIHALTAMLGYSYAYDTYRYSNLSAEDFINTALGNENLQSGSPEKMRVSNGRDYSELVSGMTRLNYTLMDKYLVTFTARLDGSSKFGRNNHWAFFPSGAFSWKIQNEEFLKEVRQVNELKPRISFGTSGNQGISPFQTIARYGQGLYYWNGQWTNAIGQGIVTGNYGPDGRILSYEGQGNPDLRWETTTQLDAGLDMAFFSNRLRVTFDYYEKRTKNLLRDSYLTPSSGFDRKKINSGEITNKGIELTVSGDFIRKSDWGFSATAIISRNRNKLVSLGNIEDNGFQTDPATGMQFVYWGGVPDKYRETGLNILAIGQPVNVFYGYRADGIIQDRFEGEAAGLTGEEAKPGELKYIDISQNGSIGDEDKTIIGNPNPKFTGSLALNFRWKNLDAELFFTGSYGNDIINIDKFGTPKTAPLRWTPDNPNNKYPSLRASRYTYRFSDYWVEDGSYLKLQSINIGYNFKLDSKKYVVSGIRLSANITNIFTLTRFTGYDPQMAGLDGIYWGGLPSMRQYTLGVKINF